MTQTQVQISATQEAIYTWMSDLDRAVAIEIDHESGRHVCSWNTASYKRMRATGEGLAEATRRAFVLDTSPDDLRRAVYEPTATNEAWTTGEKKRLFGWSGSVIITARFPRNIPELVLPNLGEGWTWSVFTDTAKKIKPARTVVRFQVLETDGQFATKIAFNYEVLTSRSQWETDDSMGVLNTIKSAFSEFERQHHQFD